MVFAYQAAGSWRASCLGWNPAGQGDRWEDSCTDSLSSKQWDPQVPQHTEEGKGCVASECAEGAREPLEHPEQRETQSSWGLSPACCNYYCYQNNPLTPVPVASPCWMDTLPLLCTQFCRASHSRGLRPSIAGTCWFLHSTKASPVPSSTSTLWKEQAD